MSVRRYLIALMAASLLSGCEREPNATEKAAADARDIAMVEAAQERHPPLQPLAPQLFSPQEIEQQAVAGVCGFERRGETQPIALLSPPRALMKLGDRPEVFASDPGGPQGPLGTWQHYVGKGRSMRVEREPGDGTTTGREALEWSARLTVRDEFDRIVFTAPGRLRCA